LRDSDHCKATAYQPEHDCLVSQSDIDLRIIQNEQAPCPKMSITMPTAAIT